MDCRPFEITLIGANDLKDVNTFTKMDVYAVVTVTGTGVPKQKLRTPVHKDGGTSPKWNHTLKFNLDDADLTADRVKIKISLVSDRTIGATKVGKAVIPSKELLTSEKATGGKPVSYVVVTPKGKTKGNVSFSYKFGEKFSAPLPVQSEAHKKAQAHEPVMAYPVGHAGSSSAYPPPPAHQAYQQPGYAYAPHPQAGYGYAPPPQAGYGYPPVVQPGYGYAQKPQKPKRGRGNMGLGLGAGLLGGLLVGDMVSDVGDMGGCGGYGDGFDF